MNKRALVSVYNKEKIADLAKELIKFNYELISTGGTVEILRKNNVPVLEVSELTKFPEILEGRVKTLHPAIHGGLLARREKKEHMESILQLSIVPIDLVIVDLYPFEIVAAKENVTFEEVVENIDIGGSSIIRSAAKNFTSVTVISDSSDYEVLLNELSENNGKTTLKFREKMATKAFQKTSSYDFAITSYLSNCNKVLENGSRGYFPEFLTLKLKLKQVLRYGENPHQKGALYLPLNSRSGMANAKQLQGKELSFNNYLDLESSWNIASEFDSLTPLCVIVKHNSPAGVAIAPNLLHAYIEAFNSDSISAFGGVVAFNNKVDLKVAKELLNVFFEAIVAPGYDEEALEVFKKKPNLRVIKIDPSIRQLNEFDIKSIDQGFLVQDANFLTIDPNELKFVTRKKPTEQEIIDLIFAWKVCKHVKSNAIVIAKDGKTLGVGGGQPSRVNSVEIAIDKANYNSSGAVLASDAFFPFKDSIEIAASARISAIIQPGGSIKDKEVIDTCDKYGISMVFTGIRHFRH